MRYVSHPYMEDRRKERHARMIATLGDHLHLVVQALLLMLVLYLFHAFMTGATELDPVMRRVQQLPPVIPVVLLLGPVGLAVALSLRFIRVGNGSARKLGRAWPLLLWSVFLYQLSTWLVRYIDFPLAWMLLALGAALLLKAVLHRMSPEEKPVAAVPSQQIAKKGNPSEQSRPQLPQPTPAPSVTPQPPAPSTPPADVPSSSTQAPPSAPPEVNIPVFESRWSQKTLGDLAGMAELKAELHAALSAFRTYRQGGQVSDRNGILLQGPPGNGKTSVALAIAGELGLPLFQLGVADLNSKWINESASRMAALFRQAAQQPCVVFLDEFDALAVRRDSDHLHAEDRKVVNTLLSEIDRARSLPIVLVAATNYPEQLDAAMVRDGRFDFRIDIPYPDEAARLAILQGLLRQHDLQVAPAAMQLASRLWVRRPVSFFEAVVKRLRDGSPGSGASHAGPIWPNRQPLNFSVLKAAARAACRRASALPKGARLRDLALASEVRQQIERLLPSLRTWERCVEAGGTPPSGLLLYGPPGSGKTHLVRALACELGDWHVFEINATAVLHDPRRFRQTVELASHHRPAFVFIDEADELLRRRSASPTSLATSEILKAMDGLMGLVPELVFVAATNHAHDLDEAALRSGRFAEKIYLGPLIGSDLRDFVAHMLRRRAAGIRLAPQVTAGALTRLFGQATPAEINGTFARAVNYTLTAYGSRALTLDDVRAAQAALRLRPAGAP